MTVEPELTDNGDGTFTAAPFEFHMPGYWVIHATVADTNGTEERADFDVAAAISLAIVAGCSADPETDPSEHAFSGAEIDRLLRHRLMERFRPTRPMRWRTTTMPNGSGITCSTTPA